jgi:DNA-3-methyladenine glycosylase
VRLKEQTLLSITATNQRNQFWRQAKPLGARALTAEAPLLARQLLGCVIVTDINKVFTAGIITEVEAYLGSSDPASHAYKGQTERNKAMFSVGGTCYVYLSYGIHYCVNVVSGKAGDGQAVLIRAVKPLYNISAMAERRGIKLIEGQRLPRHLSDGPGKLCQALGINVTHCGERFTGPILKIVNAGIKVPSDTIKVTERIGISKGQDLPLRFVASSELEMSLDLIQPR